MRSVVFSAPLAAMAACFALSAAADSLEGRWRTAPDANGGSAIVELQLCGNLICGTFTGYQDSSGAAQSAAIVGQVAVSAMEPRGAGQYRNGEVYELARERSLPGRMELQGSRLAVTTCQRMACRDQIWTRAN